MRLGFCNKMVNTILTKVTSGNLPTSDSPTLCILEFGHVNFLGPLFPACSWYLDPGHIVYALGLFVFS